ncbi:MAG: protein translocase subunit SecD [Lachnospiraceae bacterium]|nr:protein translocase subunit SecD [Lachnospiraceae bacterium]
MKKRNAVIYLIVLVLVMCGLGYMAVFGVGADKSGAASSIDLGLDLAGGVSITYQVVGDEAPSAADMADTIYKLQMRVDNYSTEAQVYQEGSDRINIEIPGVSDANAILEELGKPGSLAFYDKDGNEVLTGSDVDTAAAGSQQDSMGNQQYVVQLTLTPEGAQKFADATEAAVANHDVIYIVYDGQTVSAPAVQAKITDGNAVITGMESFEKADTLASTIRIGGLKLQLEELRSNVVGAQLGSSAIRTSLIAGAIGLALVIIFMLAVYRLPGLASSLALILYTMLDVILLDAFEITLTLPGIAGIILSIGMAVDANVIIFARVKEEIASGKTVYEALQTGFKKALSAIIDGNITTLIAAIVLGFMGTGSIKGFAQTLALGIFLSMLTALFVTRFIIRIFYALGAEDVKFYGSAKEKTPVDFLSKRFVFIAISIAAIAAGFIVMGVNSSAGKNALNYSLEVVGGTSTTVDFPQEYTLEQIDDTIVPYIEEITGDGNVQSTKVAGSNQVIFKTRTLNVSEREAFENAMVDNFQVDKSSITAESISSTISNEMRADAVIAIIVAAVCMLIYIWIRFSDVRFAASSVLALVHDVLVVLAFYAIARVSVGNTFIACMLTIVGYSINATIVIFDRIREKIKSMHDAHDPAELKGMVNEAVTQTLSRSIFTSLTTFIMVACLYVLGVSSIKEFALPLMVGILCGTYSSICLAGAMWFIFRTVFTRKAKKAK